MLLLLALILLCALSVNATEQYADDTGEQCATCHMDPAGGGTLTATGAAYAENGYKWPISPAALAEVKPPSLFSRALKLAMGLIHMLAAFTWLGTIFYVHLVLKPQYAKGGLPKTEMRIAWLSILALGVSGAVLTWMRFSSPQMMLGSRLGILLAFKIGLYLFLVGSAAFVTLALSPRLKQSRSQWQKNDGLNGKLAWVKVGDRLYDLTGSKRWQEGNHFGRHQAGEDMTEALKGAPHGEEKLEGFNSFSLMGHALDKESSSVHTLFVMAYVNLAVAFAVVVVLALMKWG